MLSFTKIASNFDQNITQYLTERETSAFYVSHRKIDNPFQQFPIPFQSFINFINNTKISSVNLSLEASVKNIKSDGYPVSSNILKVDAYHIYTKTMLHQNNKNPALLYKLRDTTWDNYQKRGFLEKESHGRIYAPAYMLQLKDPTQLKSLHSWFTNSVWLLAQVHAQRPFEISSPLVPDFIKRKKSPHTYSAFSKEIAIAVKLGYEVKDYKEGSLILSPPPLSKKEAQAITLEDIVLEDKTCEKNLSDMVNVKKEFQEACAAADFFAKIFSYLQEDCTEKYLKDASESHPKYIENRFKEIYGGGPKNKYVLPYFVKYLNDKKLHHMPKLTINFLDSPEKQLQEIKSTLIKYFRDRVEELQQTLTSLQPLKVAIT